ncbi:MAG: PD-(D/E)XK nuclease family protein [Eubacteriales bacterium]|nr:PD-(D/E)XK nuclease family protein [Eubacteriales bacterium]
MAVRILTARPHRLFPSLCKELGERREENAILMVPEQLTLQAERELMTSLKVEGLFTIDVTSPSRLYERVLETGGRDGREPLAAAGRRMAVSLSLEKLEKKLTYYGALSTRTGFIEKATALITDLKRGGMTPEGLVEYCDGLPEGITKEKLRDLSLIYEQYEKILSARFSDTEDQMSYAAGRLTQSGYLSGKHLYVYGFDTLPDQLMRFLCAAAPLCKSLTVALLCDGVGAADGELFLPIRQGIGRFFKLLDETGLEAKQQALPREPLDAPQAIRYLDENLYALRPKPFTDPQRNVFLNSGLSPYEEATLVTRQILRLLGDGMDIERIAVLYPDQNGYAFAVTVAFRDSGIPFYTDQKLPASSHGLVRYLLCALRAAAEGYQNRDVLGMLKSGYAPLSFEEGCELENYAYTCGINRQRWTQPFTRGDRERAERCEEMRRRLMEPVMKARAALVAARNAAQSMTAVFDLLRDTGAYERLCQEEERLLKNGMAARANQNSQVWQSILSLFDQMVRLSDSTRIPLSHMATRLECGFSAISLASLPPASNMLHVGTLGHSLAENIDAVFLLGLNDGVLKRDTQSLLSAEERADAQEKTGCFLGLTDESRSLFAKLDLKRAMTLPRQLLFLSYAKTSTEGAALRPLALLNTLRDQLFHSLPQSPVPEEQLPYSATQALCELSVQLRAHMDGMGGSALTQKQQEMLRKLALHPVTAPAAMRLLRALRYDGSAQPIDGDAARALFGDKTLSVSRLEQFAQCPFQHFLTYGLRPQVLREWKVDPIETGSFYHAALNGFAGLARREPGFPEVPPQRVREMTEQAIEPLLEDLMNGPMGDGDRSQARFELAKDAVCRATEVLTRQLRAGSFQLDQTEATFGYEKGMPPIVLQLPNGREVMVRGRIDRIDRFEHEGSVYLRVIDYKSSAQALDAARTWWGLQLQLLLYLGVCTDAVPGGKPAGAFYFYVADPLVESETDVQDVVEDILRKTFCLKGITLSEVEVLEAMDRGEEPCVLPPVFLKSGELRKDAKALSLQQMNALIEHTRQVAAQLAGELYGGRTEILPTREDQRAACELCDYHSICHFDFTAPDARFRELPKMSMDEMRNELEP